MMFSFEIRKNRNSGRFHCIFITPEFSFILKNRPGGKYFYQKTWKIDLNLKFAHF